MNAQDLMTPNPIRVQADTPLSTCALLLTRHRIRHLPLRSEQDRFSGLVTDAAIFRHGTYAAPGGWVSLDDGAQTAGDVALSSALTVGPYAPLSSVLTRLASSTEDAVVVLEEDLAVGIITEHDGVRLAQGLLSRETPAWSGIPRPLHTVAPTAPAAEALEVMEANHIRHVLVLSEDQTVRGVISLRDLLEDGVRLPDSRLTADAVVRQPNIIAIAPTTSAAEAARLMVRLHIGVLPVLDNSSRAVGVVTRTDLIRMVVEQLQSEDDA